MCFEWPKFFQCLHYLSLWFFSLLYLHLSGFDLTFWYRSSSIALISEAFFVDFFDWVHFIFSLVICSASTISVRCLLPVVWMYTAFLGITLDPDKVFRKIVPETRSCRRQFRKRCQPISAFCRRYVLLSYYQLHEFVDNGHSHFLLWFASQYNRFHFAIMSHLFRFQTLFHPRIPEDNLFTFFGKLLRLVRCKRSFAFH